MLTARGQSTRTMRNTKNQDKHKHEVVYGYFIILWLKTKKTYSTMLLILRNMHHVSEDEHHKMCEQHDIITLMDYSFYLNPGCVHLVVLAGGGGGAASLPCLLSLLMTCVMSTLAAILAFCSCSSWRRMMGLRLGRLFFAFCSSWASLGEKREDGWRREKKVKVSGSDALVVSGRCKHKTHRHTCRCFLFL